MNFEGYLFISLHAIVRGLFLSSFFSVKSKPKTKTKQNKPPNFKVMQINPFAIFTVIFSPLENKLYKQTSKKQTPQNWAEEVFLRYDLK